MPLAKFQDVFSSHVSTGWTSVVTNIPSIRFLLRLTISALDSAQHIFGLQAPVREQPLLRALATCSSPQLSCHNTSAIENLCCFNSPGGTLLQTQFWDTHPVTGPSDSWTIHGLWPDNCDGTYEASCDDSRAYTNITQILQSYGEANLLDYMRTYWVSDSGTAESFWEHEWAKHGTCISTLETGCYADYQPTDEVPDFFNRTVSLFQSLPSYQWLSEAGITPSFTTKYTSAEIQAALSKNLGGKQVHLGCRSGALNEIWYFFNVVGSVQFGKFQSADPVGSGSTCPSTGIRYLPKHSGNGGGGLVPTTTVDRPTGTATVVPTPTGRAFTGSGYLNVVTGGFQQGCIISKGTWYTSGTCAMFKSISMDDSFLLRGSKGNCTIASGTLTCGAIVSSAAAFTADGSSLAYNGRSTFYADGVPRRTAQGIVYTDGSAHATSLTLEWQSV